MTYDEIYKFCRDKQSMTSSQAEAIARYFATPPPAPTAADLHYLIDKAIIEARRDQRELTPATLASASEARTKAINAALATAQPAGAPGATDAERAAWLADKIGALGDYAKEAAQMLYRWPAQPAGVTEDAAYARWLESNRLPGNIRARQLFDSARAQEGEKP